MPDKITKTITIKGPVHEVFSLWANFENFPYFMKSVKSVQKEDERRSRWIVEGPLGKDLEWEAQITELQEDKRIAWNTIGGNIKTSGQVMFNSLSNDQTDVTVDMQYVPPAGKFGEAAAHIIDNPDKKLEEDLKRFKKYAETRSNF